MLNNLKHLLLGVTVIICGMMMTLLLTLCWDIKWEVVGVILSGIIFTVMVIRTKLVALIFQYKNKLNTLIILIFSVVYGGFCSYLFYQKLSIVILYRLIDIGNLNPKKCILIVTLIVSISGTAGIYFISKYIVEKFDLIQRMIKFLKNLSRNEKIFFISSTVVFLVVITILYNLTTVFTFPMHESMPIYYDVIYTTDTPAHLMQNTFMQIGAPENDIRQPLFGVFMAPFSVPVLILSRILFFIPNSYPILLAVTQWVLLSIIIILIGRLLKLKKFEQILFYSLFCSTYSVLFFSINVEQYVGAVFWLILFIYSYIEDTQNREVLYIGMTGSLLTSGVLFILISKGARLKEKLKMILCTALKFLAIVIIAGQFKIFVHSISAIRNLLQYAGNQISFIDRMKQYTHFVASCFIQPTAHRNTTTFSHVSYQLSTYTQVNILGVILLIAACLGFCLHYKDRLAQISFGWCIYSFVLLVLIGWGASENGMVLYSLYFGWAFFILIFKLVNRLFENKINLKRGIQRLGILILLSINIMGIIKLIQFGMAYYPIK